MPNMTAPPRSVETVAASPRSTHRHPPRWRAGPRAQQARRGPAAPRAKPTTDLPSDEYDYIIVGGGMAGCLLANRLSADPSKRVLVLEAGEDNKDPIIQVPAGITRLFKNPFLDWNLETTKESKSMGNVGSYIARGKLLGGSSSTNATLYHRGTAQDYDSWGLKGWGSQDVLPWFKCAEDNPAFKGSEYHNTGGAMHVDNPIFQSPIFERAFKASEEVGIKRNDDFNDWSHEQDGYGDFQVAITGRGRRADAYRQFLKPALDRDNLEVVYRAQTKRILTEQQSGGKPRAVGVEIQSVKAGSPTQPAGPASTCRVKAGGEVILAAGAIHSPQVLMVSGIGPKEHLKEQGVECVVDSPAVGSNLQDHPACLTAHLLSEDVMGRAAMTDQIYDDNGNLNLMQVLNWAVLGKGPLTCTGCDRGAFVKTDPSLKQPDLQLRYSAACALNPDGVGSFIEFGKLKSEGRVERWPTGMTFQIVACRPESRGSVRLAGPTITDRPAIDLAYCTDSGGKDARTLREGIKIARKIADASPLRPAIESEMHPGPDVQSDGDLDEYLRKTMHSANALVGTCQLGPEGKGVVSPEDLTVHGVQGLRVVDSSVVPRIPGGQTGAVTVMVAERAAHMLTQGQKSVGSTSTPQLAMA